MTRKLFCLLTAALLLGGAPFSRAERAYEPLPDALTFYQYTKEASLPGGGIERRTYPDTANAALNAEMAALIDQMGDATRHAVTGAGRADTGATALVTGTKTVSFLVSSHIWKNQKQDYVDFAARVYDIETGARLTLTDFFSRGADDMIAGEIRSQLVACFPAETPDEGALSALCAVDAISATPFVLTPAYLTFVFRADALYAGKNTLMFARIPYTRLTEWMTPLAKEQTDNSRYKTAALTFDDGPARGVTARLLLTLREGCAIATFFNLGANNRGSADYIAWENDALCAVESHTYVHDYVDLDTEMILKYRDRFAREQEAMIGVAPRLMRAPGGNDRLYARSDIGMPIIRWNCLSGDSSKVVDVEWCINQCIGLLKDHSNILMHDIRHASVEIAEQVIKRLKARGTLFVTVEEQLLINGVTPQNGVVYFGGETGEQP